MDHQLRAPHITLAPRSTSASSDLLPFALRKLSQRPFLHAFRTISAVYIFMLVLLPSGSMFGINVKVLCFMLLLPLAVQVSFASGQISIPKLVKLLLVPTVLLLWVFLSQLYGIDVSQALWQYEFLMTTICSCWFASVLCALDQENTRFLLRCVIYSEVFTSSLKLAILIYSFARGVPLPLIFGWIERFFGVKLMGYDFASIFGRFQFISDNVIPICIFALLCFRNLLSPRTGRTLFMLFVLIVSALFSFSRFLWAHTVMALVLGLLVGKKDRFQAILITVLGCLTAISLPFIIMLVTLRFSTIVVSGSDADRVEQVAALKVFIADAPWFGQGLGSYSHRVIRAPDALFSYEAQLLALFGQVGIVGVVLLLLLLLSYFRWFGPIARRSLWQAAALFLLVLVWLAGGFLNPSVISSAASVSYVAIFAMVMLDGRLAPELPLSTPKPLTPPV